MKLTSALKQYSQRRRDARAAKLPTGYIDLVELARLGLVQATGTGQSITGIKADIRSRVNIPLKVAVLHGTYFVSQGNHQNMATRREYDFQLSPMGNERINVPAACINASLPVPKESDRFAGVSRVPDTVRRFMEAAEGEEAMVIQAGVWTLTDGFSRARIQSSLRRVPKTSSGPITTLSSRGLDSVPAISNQQIDRAKSILDSLHIKHHL